MEEIELEETDCGAYVRLSVRGEVDLATAPALEHRLVRLRERGRDVRVDLSGVAFMDVRGVRALINAARDAEAQGRSIRIDPQMTHQVRRLFTLLRLGAQLRRQGGR